jgi:lysozyme family protein
MGAREVVNFVGPEKGPKLNFDEAFTRTMEFEGGDQVHQVPGDPGGLTKYGISQRAFPGLDIANLTEDQAKVIYKRDYWKRVRADDLPEPLRHHVFDAAVNFGVKKASAMLQKAINLYAAVDHTNSTAGTLIDGSIGDDTIAKVNQFPPERITALYRHIRRENYIALARAGRGKFLFGWLKRA